MQLSRVVLRTGDVYKRQDDRRVSARHTHPMANHRIERSLNNAGTSAVVRSVPVCGYVVKNLLDVRILCKLHLVCGIRDQIAHLGLASLQLDQVDNLSLIHI